MNSTAGTGIDDTQARAEAPDATGVFRIWPGQGVAPGSEHWT